MSTPTESVDPTVYTADEIGPAPDELVENIEEPGQ